MNGNGRLPKLVETPSMRRRPAQVAMPDFRQKDRERESFFRDLGTMADKYAWKRKLLKNPHKVDPPRTASSLQRAKEIIMPFPPAWVEAIFNVSRSHHLRLVALNSSLSDHHSEP